MCIKNERVAHIYPWLGPTESSIQEQTERWVFVYIPAWDLLRAQFKSKLGGGCLCVYPCLGHPQVSIGQCVLCVPLHGTSPGLYLSANWAVHVVFWTSPGLYQQAASVWIPMIPEAGCGVKWCWGTVHIHDMYQPYRVSSAKPSYFCMTLNREHILWCLCIKLAKDEVTYISHTTSL